MNARCIPIQLTTFAMVLVAAGGCAIAGQPACASVATTASLSWNTVFSPGGTWALSLAQDAQGNITGTAAYVSSACKDTPESVAGTANGDGSFSLAMTDPNGPQMCAETDFTVTLSGPGCAQATGTYTDQTGLGSTGTVKMTDSEGVQAKAETAPLFQQWETNNPAIADFWQDIVPTDYNFVGRAVTETFPGNNLANGCDKNSGSPPVVGLPTVTIYPNQLESNGITTGYGDRIGFSSDDTTIDKIREVGDAPCTISREQDISIDTATGSEQYQVNTLIYQIGITTLQVWRGPPASPSPSTQRYFPTLAVLVPSAVIAPLVVLTLLTK